MRIAVVDDNVDDALLLNKYLKQYQQENSVAMDIVIFHSSIDFLEEYQSNYDVVFLDIEMPGSTGLEVAREIRGKDSAVGIVFVTNMAQYAINGYEVNAIDFIVKPVSYYIFSMILEKALSYNRYNQQRMVLLKGDNGIERISATNIFFIRKENNNYLFYHTTAGDYWGRGSISNAAQMLTGLPFVKCSSGCIVNLNFVNRIDKNELYVENEKIVLSRRMRKEFIQRYMDYMGGSYLCSY